MNCKDVLIFILPLAFLGSCSLNSSQASLSPGQLQTPEQRLEAARRAIDGVSPKPLKLQEGRKRTWPWQKGEKKGFNLFNRKEKLKLGHNAPPSFLNMHPHPHTPTKTVVTPQKTQALRSRPKVKYMKKDLDSGMSDGLKPASSHSHGGTTHTHGNSSAHSHGSTTPRAQQPVARRISQVAAPRTSSGKNQAKVSGIKVNEQTPALSIEEINQLIDANTFPIQ